MKKKLSKIAAMALPLLLISGTAFAWEKNISTQAAMSCFDNSIIQISETKIGRSYTAQERELKLQALAINPDHDSVYRVMELVTNMASIEDVKGLLSTESNWEDWMISLVASCAITGVGWN
jgi:hypothetical protein